MGNTYVGSSIDMVWLREGEIGWVIEISPDQTLYCISGRADMGLITDSFVWGYRRYMR